MNILSIDCAIHTGWATLIDGNIRSGVQKMKSKSNESSGMKYLRFDSWLKEMDAMGSFNLIAYEKPHHLPGNAIESMNGFITGIHRYISVQECNTRRIEHLAVSPGTIKKFATGKGNADKSVIMAWFATERGVNPVDDNEADAYALLRYVMNECSVIVEV